MVTSVNTAIGGIWIRTENYRFMVRFLDGGVPPGHTSVSVDVWDAVGAPVVIADSATEFQDGWWYYDYAIVDSPDSNGLHSARFTCAATVDENGLYDFVRVSSVLTDLTASVGGAYEQALAAVTLLTDFVPFNSFTANGIISLAGVTSPSVYLVAVGVVASPVDQFVGYLFAVTGNAGLGQVAQVIHSQIDVPSGYVELTLDRALPTVPVAGSSTIALIASPLMRGTDNAALASDYTSARATKIDHLQADYTPTIAGRIDTNINSRSSHSPADVWAVGTRTLSSFGTLVNDVRDAIFNRATSALTTAGSFGKWIIDNLNAKVGDVQAKTDNLPVDPVSTTQLTARSLPTASYANATDQATLLTRLSAPRAGYLDNLNVGGNVASSSEVTAIQNNTDVVMITPAAIEKPAAGTVQFLIDIYLYDEAGHMATPDSNPTLAAQNQAGTDRSGNLAATTLTALSTGHYQTLYTLHSGDAIEQLVFTLTETRNSNTRKFSRSTQVVDSIATDFTSTDRATLVGIAADYQQRGQAVTLPSTFASDVAAQVLATPSNKLATNGSGQVTAASVQGNVTGSVASVAGNVGGNVNGNVAGSVGSLSSAEHTALVNAILNELLSGHQTAGTVGKGIADAAAGGGVTPATPQDIWTYSGTGGRSLTDKAGFELDSTAIAAVVSAVWAAHVSGIGSDPASIAALIILKLGMIGGVGTVTIRPVMEGGVLTLTEGDDYVRGERTLPSWPSYVDDVYIGSVGFPADTVVKFEQGSVSAVCTVTASGAAFHIDVELSAAQTAALATGRGHHYSITAYIPDVDAPSTPDAKLLIRGPLVMAARND